MYRCEICGELSQPYQPAHRIAYETRRTFYPKRPKANACYKRLKDGGTKFVRRDDRGGTGYEIVREVTACGRCAARIAERRAERPTRVVVDTPRRRAG
jgi:hypothetical protein